MTKVKLTKVKRSHKRRPFKNTKRTKRIKRKKRTKRKRRTKRMKGGMDAVTPVVNPVVNPVVTHVVTHGDPLMYKVTQPTKVSVSVLEPEQVKFKRLLNNLHRVSGSNMVRVCETTTGVIVVLLGDPHTYNWREGEEGEYYDKDNICASTNEWPFVEVEQHDTYKSFQTRQPPYGITDPDMENLTGDLKKMRYSDLATKAEDAGLSEEESGKIRALDKKGQIEATTTYILENQKLTATTADVVATCIETFPLSLESFVEGSSWELSRGYSRTSFWRTPLYNELYWLMKMNATETEEPRPLLVHATDYRSGGEEPIDLLLSLLSGSKFKILKKNLLKENPERFCLAEVEKTDFMAQVLPEWLEGKLQFLSNGKETLYQMHVALCGNPTGVHLRDFLACITTFGCHPDYLTDDLPIPPNFAMEDIEKATFRDLSKICRYNGYMDDILRGKLYLLEEEAEQGTIGKIEHLKAKIELLKAKIKEQNLSENILKMPVSEIYINLYSEQYNLAKANETPLLFGVFLNLFFQELSGEIGDIRGFFVHMLGVYARSQGNVAFDNKNLVLTHEGLHVYTTKIAKQLLKLQKQVFRKAFGFVANYLDWVGQKSSEGADPWPPFYGHDCMYDIFTVLRLARRCGYGEPSEGSSERSTAKAVIVIGGEGRNPICIPTVFHFVEAHVPRRGAVAMRGHSTNAFKGLYAIGVLKGVGRGGTSDEETGTDCVELSGEI